MAIAFVQHEVANYDEWRRMYDQSDKLRSRLGVKRSVVYREADHPNRVVVMNEFGSMQEAKAFAHDEDLRGVMKRAGVAPTFWLVEPEKVT